MRKVSKRSLERSHVLKSIRRRFGQTPVDAGLQPRDLQFGRDLSGLVNAEGEHVILVKVNYWFGA